MSKKNKEPSVMGEVLKAYNNMEKAQWRERLRREKRAKVSYTLSFVIHALETALCEYNAEAQRHLLGLPQGLDDIRQNLAIALSLAEGEVICGNLQRTDETRLAMQSGITFQEIIASFGKEDGDEN